MTIAELPPPPRRATKWDDKRRDALDNPGTWVRVDDALPRALDVLAARNLRARIRGGDRRWADHNFDCEIRPLDDTRRTWAVYIRHQEN